LLVYLGASNAFAQSPVVPDPAIEAHVKHVVSGLLPAVIIKDAPNQTHTLTERMAAMHVNGVSIAVIHHGAIEWAQGFGVAAVGGPQVTPDTPFQAGSISKPVAALAALHLVQQGKLSLDADVNSMLKSWKLPDAPIAAGKPVTLRELLTHTGGTTVHGFPGYAADAPVPTLVQVLNGEKPANTAAIRIETKPGTKWNYSGGGFTIMQQIVIDQSGEAFPKLLQDLVLTPIGMTHSTYQQPLPADRKAMAATPYDAEGKPIPGGAHTYPEMAAAGLWTTPSDIARYAIEIQTSLAGKSNHVLSQEMTKQMLTAGLGGWGLGVQIGGAATNPYFTHGGVNEGFESLFLAYELGGDGAVVMTNAQGGSAIAEEIMRSIAAEYKWPDEKPEVKAALAVDPKVLADYAGVYELGPNFDLTTRVADGHLTVEAPGQETLQLYASSNTKFFLVVMNAEMEFVRDEQGKVTKMILHQNGQDVPAKKK
jgi:CubicO group peptidase (beta-lactamase class C family)